MLHQILDWVQALGPWGRVLFVLLYAVAAVLFVPGLPLTVGAGALFGAVVGTLLVSAGSTLGATLAFLTGRYLVRDWVAKKMAGNSTFARIDHAIAEEGWRIVLLARLSPVLPYAVLNYAFAITRLRLGPFVLASWIGMIPPTIFYVYLGSLARVGVEHTPPSPVEWVAYVLALIATAGLAIIVTRIARKALMKRTGQGSALP